MSQSFTSLGALPQLRPGVRTRRFSSYDTAGGNADNWPIKAGESVTIADIGGAGCVKHIWMTTQEPGNNLRRLVLKFYWDGEETPSVLCPIGDFFGLGHSKANYFSSAPLQVSYLAMNSYFAMPFAHGARMVVENDSDEDSFLYFYVDYEAWPEGRNDLGRFHANWRRQMVVKKDAEVGPNARGHDQHLNKTGDDNYLMLDTKGRGHYVGSVLHVDTNETGWWGEGDDMFFIDGETWPPNIHGTGMEDYYCGAWNYNRLTVPYSTPYYGYSFKGNADYTGKHSQYRFHIQDPVYFEESLRFSIEHGHANDRQGDWSSTSYWYQVDRTGPLPDVSGFENRIPYAHGGLERWPGKDRSELPV